MGSPIEFYRDHASGVPPYQQLVQQVRRALRLGLLQEGDQLPTVKEVVAALAINPNTVSKAYRELEHTGIGAGASRSRDVCNPIAGGRGHPRARATTPRATTLDDQGTAGGPRRREHPGTDRDNVSQCGGAEGRRVSVGPIIRADRLGKRFHGRWALEECTLELPPGGVIGLVGPNGAGKSTLLALAAGLLTPTAGTIEVCGDAPAASSQQRAKIGFVGQDAPVYPTLSVADHLRLGDHLNHSWDGAFAASRLATLGLDARQRAGRLSGGQRAQLALTLGLAKRPQILLLDEPVASLDPLARRAFLSDLLGAVVERDLTVVLSSHVHERIFSRRVITSSCSWLHTCKSPGTLKRCWPRITV